MRKKYTFFGAGNMASAIIYSFLDNNVLSSDEITVYDIDANKYLPFKERNIRTASSPDDAVSFADYIILAVKPQFMSSALKSIKEVKGFENKIYISIAAGITTGFIEQTLEHRVPVFRTMPNTPFLVGKGAIAISVNDFVSENDLSYVKRTFEQVAAVSILNEDMMDSIVSVIGSSPAYVFKFIKAVLDGANKQGFATEDIIDLLLKTIEGSVEMVRHSNDIANLIDMVTSKKGTTESAIKVLDSYKFEEGIIDAMDACTKRAKELAGG